jgi:hypothetical protein
MSIVTPNPTQGEDLFDGSQAFYDHDDATDSKDAGGVYSHNATEFSATEAESWCDWFRYVNSLLSGGTPTVPEAASAAVTLPNKVYTNEGATAEVVLTLPTAAASKGPFIFYCQDADGIKIQAGAGDTIRVGSNVSTVAGYAASSAIGSSVTIVGINATEWVALTSIGLWNVA